MGVVLLLYTTFLKVCKYLRLKILMWQSFFKGNLI